MLDESSMRGGVAQARVNFTVATRFDHAASRITYLNGHHLQFSHHLYTVNSPTISPLV